MINEAQESKMIAQRAARNKQNPKVPFLINIKDGRLMPNVPMLAGRPGEKAPSGQVIPARPPHPNYRPYTGSLKASEEERMKWLESAGLKIHTVTEDAEHTGVAPRRGVVLADVEPFDIGTATVSELIEFAQQEYGKTLSPAGGLRGLRTQVGELARAAGAVTERALA
jgi:hypothetical protein